MKKTGLILAAAAASMFIVGCATQAETSATPTAAPMVQPDNHCKGMSNCKGVNNCKGVSHCKAVRGHHHHHFTHKEVQPTMNSNGGVAQ